MGQHDEHPNFQLNPLDSKTASQIQMVRSSIQKEIDEAHKLIEWLEESDLELSKILREKEYRQATLNIYLYPNFKRGDSSE